MPTPPPPPLANGSASLALALLVALARRLRAHPGLGAVGVRVECNVPDATVWVDDVLVGSAGEWKSEGHQIRAGFHRIEIRHPGYYSFFQEIELPGGGAHAVRRRRQLARAAGSELRRDGAPLPSSCSQNSIWRGTLYGARLRAQWSMMSSARQTPARTTRATTIGPPRSSVTTRACAAFTLGNASRQPSTSPSATRLPSTLTRSSSRPVIDGAPGLVLLAEVAGAQPAVVERRRSGCRRRAWAGASSAPTTRRQRAPSAPRSARSRSPASRSPLGPRDAQLDALERLPDALRILAAAIDRQRAGLRAVVAGEQPDAEALVEGLGDARPAAPSPS